jgi:hypothetical protein
MTALWAWLRRRIFIPWAIVTATLLCCDAWFDIVMDWNTPGLPVSLLTAGVGELPLAALLFYTARRLIRLSQAAAWTHSGRGELPRRLCEVELVPAPAMESIDRDEQVAESRRS